MSPFSHTIPAHRSRPFIALLILLTIVAGLWTRSSYFPFPPFCAKYGGDALWAVVVFLGCGLLFHNLSTLRLAALSLAIAWSVEFLQLSHVPWLDAVRSTRLGTLALGNTFNAPDLIAYSVGISLAALLDHPLVKFRKRPAI